MHSFLNININFTITILTDTVHNHVKLLSLIYACVAYFATLVDLEAEKYFHNSSGRSLGILLTQH